MKSMPKTTQGRINDAIRRYLSEDREQIFSRDADNNFEMGDGSLVVAGVYSEALKSPKLMNILRNYNGKTNLDDWKDCYLQTKGEQLLLL
jgi:hypothetical protein